MERLQDSTRSQDCEHSRSRGVQGERGVRRGQERAAISIQQGDTSVAPALPVTALGSLNVTRDCNEALSRVAEGVDLHVVGGWWAGRVSVESHRRMELDRAWDATY